MKVSIIIPTYNRPELLKRALSSISEQTFKDYEVIVVNDGGCPVEDVVANSEIKDKIRYFYHPENSGQSFSLNLGLENALGEYIAYLDDDDIYYPHHLETLYKFLIEKGKEVAYTKCIRTVLEPGASVVLSKKVLPDQEHDRENLIYENFIPIICVMHRKSCLERSGMFDEELKVLKDWDFLVRLSEHYHFYHIDNITCEVFHRTDKSNLTFKDAGLLRSVSESLRKKFLEKCIKQEEMLDRALKKYAEFISFHDFLVEHFGKFKKEGIERAAIFGASSSGRLFLDYLKRVGIDIVALFDSDPKKQGKRLDGVIIREPEEINNIDVDAIFIASRGFKDEIYERIKHLQEEGITIIKG